MPLRAGCTRLQARSRRLCAGYYGRAPSAPQAGTGAQPRSAGTPTGGAATVRIRYKGLQISAKNLRFWAVIPVITQMSRLYQYKAG